MELSKFCKPGDAKESMHLPAPLKTLSVAPPPPQGQGPTMIEAAGESNMNVTKPLPPRGRLYSLPLNL